MNFDDVWIVGAVLLLVAAPFLVAIWRGRRDSQRAGDAKPRRGFLGRVLDFFYMEPQLIAAVVGVFVLAAVGQSRHPPDGRRADRTRNTTRSFRLE